MRHGLRLGICVLFLASFAAEAQADIPPPFRWPWQKKPERPDPNRIPPPLPSFSAEPFTIELHDETQPVLRVTPSFYRSLRKIAMEDVPSDTHRAEAPPADHLTIAGLSLAMALVMGGLWMTRSGGGVWKMRVVVLLGITAAGLMGSAVVLAARPAPPPTPPQPLERPVERPVKIELVDQENNAVTLRVSRAYLEQLLEQTKPMLIPKDGPFLPPPPPPPSTFPMAIPK